MKLLNYTLLLLTSILFIAISAWAIFFYYQLLNEVKDTIDQGLASYKISLIANLKNNPQLLTLETLGNQNYFLRLIPAEEALQIRDTYNDTLVYSEIIKETEPRRVLTTAFAAEDSFYELKIVSQELDRKDLIAKIAGLILWLYLFLLATILIVNNFVLKNTWKPFYNLLAYLKSFRLDESRPHKPEKTIIKEFSVLNETIFKLLNTNIDTFTSQKQFIENASHELQTPLAISLNKLELLAGSAKLTDEHIAKIGNIMQILQRLAELNKALLLISKIENNQFTNSEKVNFDEIFKQVLSDFSDYVEFRKIEIHLTLNENWIYTMNRQLAEIMVRNLLKNAVFHNYNGGEIFIGLHACGFTIENTSAEPALNPSQLFKRFNKNKNKPESTGLGLSILKAITNVSGCTILYRFNPQNRHEFKIQPVFNHLPG
jgi:signal transduction histidine kinase